MIAAIYSRKSVITCKGESVENQIQICKDYGRNLGVTEYLIYEDEGFSGKNTARPEFQKMLEDAKKKKFDTLICYRLDRISRNIADFSAFMERLEKLKINFVSVREQFDTSTPMGRAMLYIASVFAQLERETIAERVKDNMLELAKTGRWLGGNPPLGFQAVKTVEKGKPVTYLQIIPEEIELVKLIFDKYLEYKSIYKVVKYLVTKNIGIEYRKWGVHPVRRVLTAPNYVITNEKVKEYCEDRGINIVGEMNGNGFIPYNQKTGTNNFKPMNEWVFATGKHKGIIKSDDWILVQEMLDKNKTKMDISRGSSKYSYLTGILRCSKCGISMRVALGNTPKGKSERTAYYSCTNKSLYGKCDNKNIRKDAMEKAVLEKLYNLSINEDEFNKIYNTKSTYDMSEIKRIKKSISSNDTAIQNLIKQMALLSIEASAYITIELERLSKENTRLKEELLGLERQKEMQNENDLKNQLFYKQLKNFKTSFEKCKDNQQRRLLISSVVRKIEWDGENINIELLN
ncbi:MAG: recombinase family protein [Bacillota bacterium]|nr:recombinase family protein [Bacillota bacterium]